jgi:hypothetical protein
MDKWRVNNKRRKEEEYVAVRTGRNNWKARV